MQTKELLQKVTQVLEDMKARDISVIDVSRMTSITDSMVVASGTSARHVKAIADELVEKMKASDARPLGVEGADQGDWVLVDLGDIVVHLMLPRVRDFYNLEKLWSVTEGNRESATVPL
ncbi:MAG: ribosome silencing factor [Chromatiales bacterium]|jgi:ribosome-associated protein